MPFQQTPKKVLAIDPGTTESAFVLFDIESNTIIEKGKLGNDKLLAVLRAYANPETQLVIEKIKSYGNVIGDYLLETCIWIGRMVQVWKDYGFDAVLIPRKTIVSTLCHSVHANDKNIKQALKDLFGGDSAVGSKKVPGVLYGVKDDIWSALAVCMAHIDLEREKTAFLLS